MCLDDAMKRKEFLPPINLNTIPEVAAGVEDQSGVVDQIFIYKLRLIKIPLEHDMQRA